MIRQIHHPSCPAGHTAGARCICPRRNAIAEGAAFVALVFAVSALPIYVLWRFVA
jgi:hypothetical protein